LAQFTIPHSATLVLNGSEVLETLGPITLNGGDITGTGTLTLAADVEQKGGPTMLSSIAVAQVVLGSATRTFTISSGYTLSGFPFAEGELGGPSSYDTYILIANTSATAGSAQVTLLVEDGTAPVTRTFALPANSRLNVAVAAWFAEAASKRFGALIESVGAVPAQIVVERAMYSNAGGVVWAAGTDALATRLP
jgi:hypothetical protein